jgi:hypothetical protein
MLSVNVIPVVMGQSTSFEIASHVCERGDAVCVCVCVCVMGKNANGDIWYLRERRMKCPGEGFATFFGGGAWAQYKFMNFCVRGLMAMQWRAVA